MRAAAAEGLQQRLSGEGGGKADAPVLIGDVAQGAVQAALGGAREEGVHQVGGLSSGGEEGIGGQIQPRGAQSAAHSLRLPGGLIPKTLLVSDLLADVLRPDNHPADVSVLVRQGEIAGLIPPEALGAVIAQIPELPAARLGAGASHGREHLLQRVRMNGGGGRERVQIPGDRALYVAPLPVKQLNPGQVGTGLIVQAHRVGAGQQQPAQLGAVAHLLPGLPLSRDVGADGEKGAVSLRRPEIRPEGAPAHLAAPALYAKEGAQPSPRRTGALPGAQESRPILGINAAEGIGGGALEKLRLGIP